jgi:hypothetical protein
MMVNSELERIRKEVVKAYFKVALLFRHLHIGAKKNYKKNLKKD